MSLIRTGQTCSRMHMSPVLHVFYEFPLDVTYVGKLVTKRAPGLLGNCRCMSSDSSNGASAEEEVSIGEKKKNKNENAVKAQNRVSRRFQKLRTVTEERDVTKNASSSSTRLSEAVQTLKSSVPDKSDIIRNVVSGGAKAVQSIKSSVPDTTHMTNMMKNVSSSTAKFSEAVSKSVSEIQISPSTIKSNVSDRLKRSREQKSKKRWSKKQQKESERAKQLPPEEAKSSSEVFDFHQMCIRNV